MDGACPGSPDRGLSDVGVLVMEMMIGGAFQGKSALAEKRYPQVNWINGADADWEMLSCAKGVLGFHEYIRKEMKAGRSVDQLAEDLIRVNPDVSLYLMKLAMVLCRSMHLTELTVKRWEGSVRSWQVTVTG